MHALFWNNLWRHRLLNSGGTTQWYTCTINRGREAMTFRGGPKGVKHCHAPPPPKRPKMAQNQHIPRYKKKTMHLLFVKVWSLLLVRPYVIDIRLLFINWGASLKSDRSHIPLSGFAIDNLPISSAALILSIREKVLPALLFDIDSSHPYRYKCQRRYGIRWCSPWDWALPPNLACLVRYNMLVIYRCVCYLWASCVFIRNPFLRFPSLDNIRRTLTASVENEDEVKSFEFPRISGFMT